MTTTKIDTIEDLMRILDDHPEWLEAMRMRLLTRELIEMPQRLAEFMAATNERLGNLEGRFDKLEERFDKLEERFDKLEGRFDNLEGRFDKMAIDVGNLKGAHAKSVAISEADVIAESVGLRLTRVLAGQEISDLARRKDVTDIPRNEMLSFRRADVIMEAADPDSAVSYVAVEVSYTVNERDVERAVRNAGMLARFTGKPAHAVVAGLRLDNRVEGAVASGAVFWHEMDAHALQAD